MSKRSPYNNNKLIIPYTKTVFYRGYKGKEQTVLPKIKAVITDASCSAHTYDGRQSSCIAEGGIYLVVEMTTETGGMVNRNGRLAYEVSEVKEDVKVCISTRKFIMKSSDLIMSFPGLHLDSCSSKEIQSMYSTYAEYITIQYAMDILAEFSHKFRVSDNLVIYTDSLNCVFASRSSNLYMGVKEVFYYGLSDFITEKMTEWVRKLGVSIALEHVKAHKDDDKDINRIDVISAANRIADTIASLRKINRERAIPVRVLEVPADMNGLRFINLYIMLLRANMDSDESKEFNPLPKFNFSTETKDYFPGFNAQEFNISAAGYVPC